MSTVLRFRPVARSEGERTLPPTPCKIVIFPGVRIERHGEPQSSDGAVMAIEARDRKDPPVSHAN